MLSRDPAIPRLRRALIAPCTTTIRGLPSEVVLKPGVDPAPHPCVVNLDSVQSISIAILTERLGRLEGQRMASICDALANRRRMRVNAGIALRRLRESRRLLPH